MNSPKLLEARKYEEENEKVLNQNERPAFHLAARVGWMNDPNGFSLYQGKYHMFYQYHPYSTVWGPMHWAHAVSEDLLHWEMLPAAMAPDQEYDKDGCFSGSAIELENGRQLLMYTGVNKVQEKGHILELQTQCLAVGDGVNYEKYEKNPVLDGENLPEGFSRVDFRDPKIWKKKDGTYACVVGNRSADGSGQFLLFESPDGFAWTFRKVLLENRNRFGKMWECPDFLELDGKYVFLTSPQDMQAEGHEYHSGNGTLCLIGDYDEETAEFTEQADQAIDHGIDFYAPQTLKTPDGRTIMIGWMQNWDTCAMRGEDMKWYGQMSLPRELSIRDGRLYQQPVRELEKVRGEKTVYEHVLVDGELKLDGIDGRLVDLELTLEPEEGAELYHKFTMQFAQDEKYHTDLHFRPYEESVEVDRRFAGSRRALFHQSECRVEGSADGKVKLRIILDRCSAEVFIDDGRYAMSVTFYTPQSAKEITFKTLGKVRMDVVKYELIGKN